MTAPLWSWKIAIRNSDLDSMTRLVLWALSTFMSVNGDGAFPSIETLASASNLSRKSAGQHLKKAADAGWIRRELRTEGRRRSGYVYCIQSPPQQPKPASAIQETSRRSGNVVPMDRERRSLRNGNVVPPTNKNTNSNKQKGEIKSFDVIWDMFPRRPGSRESSARAVWSRLSPELQHRKMRAAMTFRQKFNDDHASPQQREAALHYVPFLSSWLERNDEEID